MLASDEHNHILVKLQNINNNSSVLKSAIQAYKTAYESLTKAEVEKIVNNALGDHTQSIYEEERSVIVTEEQNVMFMQAMAQHPEMKPVDSILNENGEFINTDNFMFNAHRAAYNHAYGIPHNSMAAVLVGYVAGIRNLEWDVLETNEATGVNKVNVVSHDLATNRLTGDFFGGSQLVSANSFDTIRNITYTILDPLADMPSIETNSNVKLLKSVDMMRFIHSYLTPTEGAAGILSYIDARNDSPISFLKLLHDNTEYKNKAVVKFYPIGKAANHPADIHMDLGINHIIDEYATRYTSGNKVQAKQEISTMNALLVIGSYSFTYENGQGVAHDSAVTKQNLIDAGMPYSVSSTSGAKTFDGQAIFDTATLQKIENETWGYFQGIAGYAKHMNLKVLQFSLYKSLFNLHERIEKEGITEDIRTYYEGISAESKVLSAVLDNLIYLHDQTKKGTFDGQEPTLRQRLNTTHDSAHPTGTPTMPLRNAMLLTLISLCKMAVGISITTWFVVVSQRKIANAA